MYSLGKKIPTELKVSILPKPSWVKISQIRTLSVESIGKTSPEELTQVVEGLNEIIGT
jgi:mRNA interferase MazF